MQFVEGAHDALRKIQRNLITSKAVLPAPAVNGVVAIGTGPRTAFIWRLLACAAYAGHAVVREHSCGWVVVADAGNANHAWHALG